MSEKYLGEIRKFAGDTAPPGWVFCHGQELRVEQYEDLYGLIGITYGGDGVTTFRTPELHDKQQIRTKADTASSQHFIMATEGLVPDCF
ncbi:phage tail protein [Paenibacillus dokdonensis]|uniref:phage tail protein n=1 Tax=Paenibacillus dokdonensis TaxID=2567944 RepID=UPI002DBC5A52|nr:phage tail protein [Paenibacillus dokdonensis]